jgi:CheY-like chemotaxis protein
MSKIKILWADDEIDLLKPHVLFLEEKGYEVTTVNNGSDALDEVSENSYNIVFLDENMPGLSGLETLVKIKAKHPSLPIIMITKSEEESIMDDAIGSKISDYLIKPVNPKQILLTLKKHLDHSRLVTEKTTSAYQMEFRNIGMELADRLDTREWIEMYKKLVYWELELESSEDEGMHEILNMQKSEAGNLFARFVEDNYEDWVNGNSDDIPLLSHNLIAKKIAPSLKVDNQPPVFLIVIDNLRYDQWRTLRPFFSKRFTIEEEDLFYSILPTTTEFARNTLFAGLLPSEIKKKYPRYWVEDGDEGSKNQYEQELLQENLKRMGKDCKFSYNKITNLRAGKKLLDNISNLMNNPFNVIVYNFVDMLSHARTEMEVIRELADDEKAYRSITQSWFEHSPLFEIIKKISEVKSRVYIATDHGSVFVDNPVKVIGDRETNTNLRFKYGRNLSFNEKEVFHPENPESVFLPRHNVSTNYIFAKGKDFFVYPNNLNHFMKYYKNTFQHGGISMEEVMIPFVSMKSKV